MDGEIWQNEICRGDFIGGFLIGEIFVSNGAVPILDTAIGVFASGWVVGGRDSGEMLEHVGYRFLLGDLMLRLGIGKILAAGCAVPIFDVALTCWSGCLIRSMGEGGVIVGVNRQVNLVA